jgi:putative SOS response-associated peptidase YedK
MCGRFSITTRKELLEDRFHAEVVGELTPRYNAAPTQMLPVIINDEPTNIVLMQWGIMPSWVEAVTGKKQLINVRAESITEKKAFREDLEHRRCLILADGFYEWRTDEDKKKTPFRFMLKTENIFAFAGIWEENTLLDGTTRRTFAIITTAANRLIKPVHHRMPVILAASEEREWLTIEKGLRHDVSLLDAYPTTEMQFEELARGSI